MGLQVQSSPSFIGSSLTVLGNTDLKGNLIHEGTSLGFYGHGSAVQQGVYTVAGVYNPAMAGASAAGVATTASTSVAPFGYSTGAQADAIPVAINALEADVATLRGNVNAIITGLQASGLFR